MNKIPPFKCRFALSTCTSVAGLLPLFTGPLLAQDHARTSVPMAVTATSVSQTSNSTAAPTLDAEHPLSSVKGESKQEHDARMAWWREAKFGMFIHWGVYSVPAGYYHGKPVERAGEWIMNNAKIPVAEYQAFAKEFNPVCFDSAKFVAAAKSAGMKYIVITSKHHDGFAMFDTKASDWSIVRATPYGKDPLKEIAEECRKQGIKLGFYYSQAQDWNNGGSAAHGGHWDKAQDRNMDDYLDKIAIPQIKELLTNYGSGTPAVIWWDTPVEMNPQRSERIQRVVQSLRPGVIQNDRLNDGKEARLSRKGLYPGDTTTPEQFVPPQGFPGRDWETCMTMNGTWGFKKEDANWKSSETLIRNLCDIASKGGNYLLNVGPDSLGNIPEESLKRLSEIGNWMKVNGEAIYGSGPTPFDGLMGSFSPTERDKEGHPKFIPEWKWRATSKPGRIYLMVFDWPKDGAFQIPKTSRKFVSARLLADPTVKLSLLENDDGSGTILKGLPERAPDSSASVIVLEE